MRERAEFARTRFLVNQRYDNGTFKGSGSSTTHKYTWDDHYGWFDAGTRQFTWHYDALGRQIARTKVGSGGASDIHIYYDGLDDIEVCTWASSTETQSRRMVYGERINELLEHTDVSADPDVIYYAHADKLDSVMVLAKSDGSIAESYRYTEYGQPTVVDSSFAKLTTLSSNINNWKRYTGQEHAMPSTVTDPWFFYRARAYRADAGRFVQRDPRHYSDSSNTYHYVGASPVTYVDPLGSGIVILIFTPPTCEESCNYDYNTKKLNCWLMPKPEYVSEEWGYWFYEEAKRECYKKAKQENDECMNKCKGVGPIA